MEQIESRSLEIDGLTRSCSISAIDMQATWCFPRIDDGSTTPSFLIPTTPLAAPYVSERF
jgi:hypothetical protein